MTEPATSRQEFPVLVPAGGDELFGVLTEPVRGPRGLAAVMLSGGAWSPSPGRNRIWVRLARELAGDGVHSLRFDYHGVGESTGRLDRFDLREPCVDDAIAAVAWLAAEEAIRDVVLIGTCFGARTALASASRLPGLRGLAVLPIPVRDFAMGERLNTLPLSWYARTAVRPRVLAGLVSSERRSHYSGVLKSRVRAAVGRPRRQGGPGPGESRTSPSVPAELAAVLGRGIPVLAVFGDEDDYFDDWKRGIRGELGLVVDGAGDLFTIEVLPGKVHGLTTTDVQDNVVALVKTWLATVTGGCSNGR